MEVENLPSASWRPRKAGSIILVQTRILDNRGSQYCKSQSESEVPRTRSSDVQRQEKMDVLAQAREQIHPSSAFCSMQTLNRLDDAQLQVVTFTQSTNSNAKLFQKHPHRHTSK